MKKYIIVVIIICFIINLNAQTEYSLDSLERLPVITTSIDSILGLHAKLFPVRTVSDTMQTGKYFHIEGTVEEYYLGMGCIHHIGCGAGSYKIAIDGGKYLYLLSIVNLNALLGKDKKLSLDVRYVTQQDLKLVDKVYNVFDVNDFFLMPYKFDK
jgi:hypothetical protein